MDSEVGASIRRPVYRGSQMVRALWFDIALLGEAQARRRLLAGWESGSRAWRLHGGYLLEWPRARRLQCERAPGLPLCDQDGILASAPLLPAERSGVAPGSALLVLGASVHAEMLVPELRVDPSTWLDLSALPVCVALAMPAGPKDGFVTSVAAPAADVRAALGDAVPPPSQERAAFLRQMQQARRDAGKTAASKAAHALGAAAAGTFLGLGGLIAALRSLLPGAGAGASSGAGSGAGARGSGSAGTTPKPAASGWRQRLAGLAMLTRVSKLLGWRQASYLRKLVKQFEDGDIDEALRHAIPLDNPAAADNPAFGVQGRRSSLEIGGPNASASGIGLDAEFLQFLRTTYQRSFEQLDRAGRIDEAAFVLAELMRRHQEAVDYLERKDRIAQAAQLAETLQLPPAVLVRLHCMVGNAARAVLLARAHGFDALGDAVAELERRGHAGASALRLEWAQGLAARGDLVEAASAIWPLEEERDRARAWLHAAEGAGGSLGVQGLVWKLALEPDARQGAGAAVQDLLYAEDLEGARQRVRACDCLLKLDAHNPLTRRLAAELWRRLLADRAASRNAVPQEVLKKLLVLAADPVLSSDTPKSGVPGLPMPAPLLRRTAPLDLSFAERGLLPLADVRRLPDGGWLLALGEAGVALARADGSELVRFPVPAHRLVLAHNGRHALALAGREKAMRVSRIDLLQRKASDWFSAGLDFWADEHDGASWNVVANGRLMALDINAPGQSVLWQVSDLPGRVLGFDQHGDLQALLLSDGVVIEQWRYALPQRRLMGREQWSVDATSYAVLPDCRDARALVVSRDTDEYARTAYLSLSGPSHGKAWRATSRIVLPSFDALPRVSLHGNLLLLRFDSADSMHYALSDDGGQVLASLRLLDAVDINASVQDGYVLVWDQRGRVIELELATSSARIVTFG